MDDVLVHDLETLIGMGPQGSGRKAAFQTTMGVMLSQGYALIGIVPDSTSTPGIPGSPWFIFQRSA